MKILTRMREIREELEELGKKDDLTSAEEKRFDELVIEFDELRRKDDLSDINKFMKAPIDKPMKPDIRGSDTEPKIKLYNRNNIDELRTYLKSQDQSGIEEPISAGAYVRSLITGDWSNSPNEKRLLTGKTSGGAYLLPDIVSSIIIPMALAKSQTFVGGMQSVPMSDRFLTIAKVIEMPKTEWKKEGEKYAKDLGMTFSGITLEAKTIISILVISLELIQDATSVNMEQVLEGLIAESLALEIDRVVLNGAGGLEPRGILQTEGILEEDLENKPIESYDFLSRANTKLLNANEKPSALICQSQLFGDLDLLKNKDDDPLKPPVSYTGEGTNRPSYLKLPSNQLSGVGLIGDFSKCLLGVRTDIQIDVSDKGSDAFKSLNVLIRLFQRIDVGIKRPKAFCKIANYGAVAS